MSRVQSNGIAYIVQVSPDHFAWQKAGSYKRTVARLEQNVGVGVYPHVRVLVLSYAYYSLDAISMFFQRVDPALIYGLVAKLHNLEVIRCEASLEYASNLFPLSDRGRWTRNSLPPLLFRHLNARQHAPAF